MKKQFLLALSIYFKLSGTCDISHEDLVTYKKVFKKIVKVESTGCLRRALLSITGCL